MKKISQFLSQFLDTNLLCPSFLFSQHVSFNHCKITDSCFQNSLSFSPDLTEKQRLRGADGASLLDIQKKKKNMQICKRVVCQSSVSHSVMSNSLQLYGLQPIQSIDRGLYQSNFLDYSFICNTFITCDHLFPSDLGKIEPIPFHILLKVQCEP